jgi:hypothetical protein
MPLLPAALQSYPSLFAELNSLFLPAVKDRGLRSRHQVIN